MKLLFLGDFYFDYDHIPKDFMTICDYCSNNGYKTVVNFEATIGDSGTRIIKRGPNLKHSRVVLDALKSLSVQAVCLANNHTMDFGGSALLESINLLREAGIPYVGAGETLDEAIKPLHIKENNEHIIIQNFGWNIEETIYAEKSKPGCAPLDRQLIPKLTKELREQYPSAIIIDVFHWGFEFNTYPMPIDIHLAHQCIDNGADLIIGHHPHVIQPIEQWHGKEIFYSLGNFYFSSRRDTYTRQFKNEPVENMCDYGLGVIFDTEKKAYDCIQFRYNQGQSKILDEVLFLNNMTGIEWNSKDYYQMAMKHSSGINPILGLDDRQNQRNLKKLFFRYSVAKKIGFLKKSNIGKRIYYFLKEKSK